MNKGCKSIVVAAFAGMMLSSASAFAFDYDLNIDTPKGIKWSEVNSSGANTVEVRLPESVTKYYLYEYTKPADFTISNNRIYDTLDAVNTNKVLFQDITAEVNGVIYNTQKNSDININADFINNNAATIINLKAELGDISGNFINNSGALSNEGYSSKMSSMGNITGNFINNSSTAINNSYAKMGDITGNFINNLSKDGGAAIYNANYFSSIGTITGNFINNTVNIDAYYKGGGAICNVDNGKIASITGNFINNSVFNPSSVAMGGAISTTGAIPYISGNFIENKAVSESDNLARGGAISFEGGKSSIVNSNFYNNSASSQNVTSKGGAIYTNSHLNIVADNAVSEFTGNYVQSANGEKDYNAIYVDHYDSFNSSWLVTFYYPGSLTLDAKNNGKIIMNDKISGISHYMDTEFGYDEDGDGINYSLHFTGDSTGSIILNNNVESESFKEGLHGNADITLSNTTLHLATRDNVLDHNNLTLNSGHFNLINNQPGLSTLNSFTVSGDTNMSVDVDLSNKTMDRIISPTYGAHTGTLNVSHLHLLSDAGRDFTAIYFAEPGLKNNVSTTVNEVAYTPIYKYTVSYDNQNQYDDLGDGGYFLFTRGTGSTNPSDSFNPAVLTTPVSNVAASQSTVNETFKYVFEHADAFSQMPLVERMSYLNANKYALSTTYNENLGRITYSQNNAAWLRPYTTFESINLKNGPKVDAITYGSLAGFDGNFKEMHRGWYRIGTGYLGYNGSQLNYHHNDTTMNGGLLGFTETFYKKNFWTALTLSAGASVGETRTMYGKEDFTTLLAGVGSKTGYNLEFQEGKYILQPIMFLSYTFVNTFDYTNASGTRISTTPAHSIQLNPSFRFITNCKNGWQPYASVGMVWNLMNTSDIRANGIKLPEMSMKPYVEYGLGLQRNWKERFTAFGQAMVRNGGRNGVALTFGFRWAIGKESEDL